MTRDYPRFDINTLFSLHPSSLSGRIRPTLLQFLRPGPFLHVNDVLFSTQADKDLRCDGGSLIELFGAEFGHIHPRLRGKTVRLDIADHLRSRRIV